MTAPIAPPLAWHDAQELAPSCAEAAVLHRKSVAKWFGSKVRKARLSLGLTQRAVALEVGIGESEVSLLESGKRIPDVDETLAICAVLGVDPGEFLAAAVPVISKPAA